MKPATTELLRLYAALALLAMGCEPPARIPYDKRTYEAQCRKAGGTVIGEAGWLHCVAPIPDSVVLRQVLP